MWECKEAAQTRYASMQNLLHIGNKLVARLIQLIVASADNQPTTSCWRNIYVQVVINFVLTYSILIKYFSANLLGPGLKADDIFINGFVWLTSFICMSIYSRNLRSSQMPLPQAKVLTNQRSIERHNAANSIKVVQTLTSKREKSILLWWDCLWLMHTSGDRAFVRAGPFLWNSLPLDIRASSSVDCFKRHLKTFLFRDAYISSVFHIDNF